MPGGGAVTDTGDATYDLPLWVPEGPMGAQPALSIRYSGGRSYGPLGVGFNLSGLSAIAPCNRTVASEGVADGVRFDGDPEKGDVYCMDGKKLVPYTDHHFEIPKFATSYHTEVESFEHVVAERTRDATQQPVRFLAYDRDGGVRTYFAYKAVRWSGVDAASQLKAGDPVVARWLLGKYVDRNGNQVIYTYDNEGIGMNAQGVPFELGVRIRQIDYAYVGSTPRRQIKFDYKSHPFPIIRYSNGVRSVSRSTLSTISMYAPNPTSVQKVWSYDLRYKISAETGRWTLTSVQLFDQFGVGSWIRSFEWKKRKGVNAIPNELREFGDLAMGSDGGTLREYNSTTPPPPTPWLRGNDTRLILFDIDSDGDSDALYRTEPSTVEVDTQFATYRVRRGKLFVRRSFDGTPLGGDNPADVTDRLEPGWSEFGEIDLGKKGTSTLLGKSRIADVDGDGRPDFMLAQYEFDESGLSGVADDKRFKHRSRYGFSTLFGARTYYEGPHQIVLDYDDGIDETTFFAPFMREVKFGSKWFLQDWFKLPSYQRVLADLDGDGRAEVIDPLRNDYVDLDAKYREDWDFQADWQDPNDSQAPHDYRTELSTIAGEKNFETPWSCGNDRAIVTDVDGNGRHDALISSEFSEADPISGHHTYVGLSVSAQGEEQQAPTSKLTAGDCASKINSDLVMGDWNGDGLLDAFYPPGSFVMGYDANGTAVFNAIPLVRWNSGNGFGVAESIPVVGAAEDVAALEQKVPKGLDGKPVLWDRGTRVADVDGDGRSDIVVVREDIEKCVMSRLDPEETGDICENRAIVYRSQGDKFYAEKLFTWQDAGAGAPLTHGFTLTQVGDVTGDGSPDLVHVADGKFWTIEMPWRDSVDLIEKVSDSSTHGSIALETFEYSNRWWGDAPRREVTRDDETGPYVCDWPLSCIPGGFTVVRSHKIFAGTRSAGTPMYRTQVHRFEGPKRSLIGRGNLGFEVHEIWDRELGSLRTRRFDNGEEVDVNGTNEPGAVFYPFAGTATNDVTVTPRYNVTTPSQQATNAFAPGLSSSTRYDVRTVGTTTTYLLRGDESRRILTVLPETTRTTTADEQRQFGLTAENVPSWGIAPSSLGNLTKGAYEYDVHGNQKLATTTVEPLPFGQVQQTRIVTSEYDTPTTSSPQANRWDRHRPVSVTQQAYDKDDTVKPLRVMRTKYDEKGNAQIVVQRASKPGFEGCMVIGSQEECEDTAKIVEHERNPNGTVREIIQKTDDPEDEERHTTVNWDADGVYPWSATNGVGHTTVLLRHPAFGVTVLAIDPNGNQSTSSYDGFGRLLTLTPEGGMGLAYSYSTYSDGDRRGLNIALKTASNRESYVRTDELGRTVSSGEKGFDGSMVTSTNHFDVHGNLELAGLPHFSGDSPGYVETESDRLGQVLSRKNPGDAPSRYTHTLAKTTTRDPEGHTSYVLRDTIGRTVESGHYATGTTTPVGEVTFTYAAFDQIESVTGAENNKRLHAYDSFGRRSRDRDPDTGSTTYTYDGFSQVRTRSRATEDIENTYDQLGRLLTSIDDDGYLMERKYDEGSNAKGKLSAMSSPDVETSFTYDSYGRVWGISQSVRSETAMSVYHRYDQYGRLKYQLYPTVGTTRVTAQFNYNTNGFPSEVLDATHCSIPIDASMPTNGFCYPTSIWRAEVRDARSLPKTIKWGNTSTETRTYDARGRITNINAIGRDTDYAYDDDGLLMRRTENTGQIERFTYDELHRIDTWNLHTVPKDKRLPEQDILTDYDYDELGNMEKVTRGALITYQATYDHGGRPHAVGWSNVTPNFSYDGSGRQYRAGSRTTTFTSFDLPKRIVDGTTKEFLYDGGGKRARLVNGTATTTYLGALYERRVTTGGTKHVFHIYGESGQIAQIDQTGSGTRTTRFISSDGLGSPMVIRRLDGGDEISFFDPFGNRFDDTGTVITDPHSGTTRGFTGAEEDDSKLVNLQGRIYDRKQFRFISPDPVIVSPQFGQAYNPYAYVLNNPLNLVDPTGYQTTSAENEAAASSGDYQTGDWGSPNSSGDMGPIASGPIAGVEGQQDTSYSSNEIDMVSTDGAVKPGPARSTIITSIPNVKAVEPTRFTPITDAITKAGRAYFDIKNPFVDAVFENFVKTLPVTYGETGFQMFISMLESPAIAADLAGQHWGRAELLDAAGLTEASFDERLAAWQSGALAVFHAASLVRTVAGIGGALKEFAAEHWTVRRADEIASQMHRHAQNGRTVGVLETRGPTIVGTGARDMSHREASTLLKGESEYLARWGHNHAEPTIDRHARITGLIPKVLGASHDFCDDCLEYLIDQDYDIVGPRTAVYKGSL